MVVRLRLTARQHRALAARAERKWLLIRAARELRRAADRPGLTAELTAAEIYAFAEHVGEITLSIRGEVLHQAAIAREGEAREASKRQVMQARHRALRERLGSAG